jgi:hypothetical protein
MMLLRIERPLYHVTARLGDLETSVKELNPLTDREAILDSDMTLLRVECERPLNHVTRDGEIAAPIISFALKLASCSPKPHFHRG